MTTGIARWGAQRLSASTKQSPSLESNTATPPCGAQRLSASTKQSPDCRRCESLLFSVLNAFRHQRNNHTSERRGSARVRYVLNAFRHQRNNHPRLGPRSLRRSAVLNAFRHQRNNHSDFGGVDATDFYVLNAFRHQRNNHPARSLPPWPNSLCAQRLSASTKQSQGGVIAIGAQVARAQRLSASTKQSPSNPSGRGHAYVLCSTPFGINETITASCRRITRDWRSAQRLSASTKQSPFDSHNAEWFFQVLNAFRHQRNNHRIWSNRQDES